MWILDHCPVMLVHNFTDTWKPWIICDNKNSSVIVSLLDNSFQSFTTRNVASFFNCSDADSDIEFLLPDPPFTRFHGLGVSLGAALKLIHLQRTDCLLQSQGRAHQTHLQGQSRFFDRITSSDFCEVILHCNSRPQTQRHSSFIRLETLRLL